MVLVAQLPVIGVGSKSCRAGQVLIDQGSRSLGSGKKGEFVITVLVPACIKDGGSGWPIVNYIELIKEVVGMDREFESSLDSPLQPLQDGGRCPFLRKI